MKTLCPCVRLLAVCLFALLAAGVPTQLAQACHTHDHALYLQSVGVAVPDRMMNALARIPVDYTPIPTPRFGATPCVDGMAGEFPCNNVDLLAFLPLASIGGGSGNDIWGWTDPVTGVEWALMGRTNGTAFVSLEDPTNPVYVANLPTQTGTRPWRDIKVYADHAFIVSDSNGVHGMQVFDLTQLRTITNPPVTFNTTTDLTAWYNGVASAHNIAIDEATGFAYIVGSNNGGTTCTGGLHMVDISDPANPTFAGCYSGDGYTHDVECIVYQGPDAAHTGDEICFAANTDTLTIVDVTDKSAPTQLSRNGYAGSGYTHQGWLTPDQRYFIVDDELDEENTGHSRYTYVWDISDLEQPVLDGHYTATGDRAPAIDHNQYVVGDFSYQSNYRAGLSILHIDDPAAAAMTEVGYFDTYPTDDLVGFSGAWSNYPYFGRGIVIVSDINRGLFVLRTKLIFQDSFEAGDISHWSNFAP